MPEFEPKNPDYDARVRDSFERQKVMQTLGIGIAGLSPGRIVLEMVHNDALTQQHGFLHAGIVSTALVRVSVNSSVPPASIRLRSTASWPPKS